MRFLRLFAGLSLKDHVRIEVISEMLGIVSIVRDRRRYRSQCIALLRQMVSTEYLGKEKFVKTVMPVVSTHMVRGCPILACTEHGEEEEEGERGGGTVGGKEDEGMKEGVRKT